MMENERRRFETSFNSFTYFKIYKIGRKDQAQTTTLNPAGNRYQHLCYNLTNHLAIRKEKHACEGF